MQTNNVYYAERPEQVEVTVRGGKALVDFPVNVSEVETEEGTMYLAESVYSFLTVAVDGLEERIKSNYDAWLAKAKEVEPQAVSLSDVVEAINTLTDIVLGGM